MNKLSEKNLYADWSQLGVGFGEAFSKKSWVSLEKLILKTAQVGRQEPRLLFGMRAWLIKHHDLINRSLLIALVKKSKSTAVLGAVLDSVLERVPRSGLKYVLPYCQANPKPVFLFKKVENSKVLAALNKRENLKVWKRWGLISREMEDMEGAVADKPYVLKNNLNLALRALFGPGIRAEIFYFLLQHEAGNAYQIAAYLGFSYEPIYSELKLCQQIGLLSVKKIGKALVYQLRPRLLKKSLRPLFN